MTAALLRRRAPLAASAAAVVALAACGGAALPDDPSNAVAEGLEAVGEAGFAWELVLDTEPDPDAPQEANAFVVAARGLEASGVSTPDGGASFRLAYPGAGSIDGVTVVDGDEATAHLRVDVPALDPALFDEAFLAVESEDLTPEQEADAELLLRLARDVTSGWVAIEGDLDELMAAQGGDGAIDDPLGEDREEAVDAIEEVLAGMPDAPEVDVEGLLDDVASTFGSDWGGFADRFLVLTEVASGGEGDDVDAERVVEVALAAQDATLSLLDVIEANVELDDGAEVDEGREEVREQFPERIGGVTATLSDRYVTSLSFDLEDFLASMGVTEAETGPIPSFVATVEMDDIGSAEAPSAPQDVVATYDAAELAAAVERLQELAAQGGGPIGFSPATTDA